MSQQTSEMEQRRAAFEARRAELLAAGYHEQKRTITILQANLYALATAGPVAMLTVLLYLMRWQGMWFSVSLPKILLLLCGFIISIPLHEALHGLAWGLCCKEGFRSIRFGFMREYLTPYCHCREPLGFGAYLLGGLFPFLVLGLGIFALAWAKGDALMLVLALFNIIAAGGDTTVAWMLRRHRRAVLLDHPSECGFVAFCRGGPRGRPRGGASI